MQNLVMIVLGMFAMTAGLSAGAVQAADLTLNDLPIPVQKSIQAEVGDSEIVTIHHAKADDGDAYRITWTVDRVIVHTTYSATGSVADRAVEIPSALVAAEETEVDDEDADEEAEQFEREITIDLVPEPAKSTILTEAGEHELAEVEIIVTAGRLLYDADWIVGGDEIAITVSPEGEVVDREIEPVEEDDD